MNFPSRVGLSVTFAAPTPPKATVSGNGMLALQHQRRDCYLSSLSVAEQVPLGVNLSTFAFTRLWARAIPLVECLTTPMDRHQPW